MMTRIQMNLPFYFTVESRGFFNMLNNAFIRHGWVFFAFLFVTGQWLEWKVYATLLVHILLVALLYEIGYILNDGFAEKNEKNPTEKRFKLDAKSGQIAEMVLVRLLILLPLHHFFMEYLSPLYGVAILFLSIAYLFHNSLETRHRIVTFFMLRILRAIATYAFCLTAFSQELTMLVLAGILGDALYYVLFYATYKLHGDSSQFDEKTDFFRLYFMLGAVLLTVVTLGMYGGHATAFIVGVTGYFLATWFVRIAKNKFICPQFLRVIKSKNPLQ